jgi:hypothetical protein
MRCRSVGNQGETADYIRDCRLTHLDEGGFSLKLSLVSIELFSSIFARVLLLTQVSHPFRGSKALAALQIAPM